MIHIKTRSEIEKMRCAGKIVAVAHEEVRKAIKPGVSTLELDTIAYEYILSQGATPSFKGYHGFPASICASINNEVVHGIPNKDRILQEGDIIAIDIGAYFDGYHGDCAKTHGVGQIDELAQKLIDVTTKSFFEGIAYAKEGYRLFDISNAIQTYVESHGFSIVRDLVGHGIGKALHEEPQVPNYGPAGRGVRLRSGMTLAIEPMVNAGRYEVKTLSDDWTVVTKDGSLSAHFEHTIALTDGEPELLTIL